MIKHLKENKQHRHANGGGWVADTATVADSAYVGPDAQVYEYAWVHESAWVSGDARVYGYAQVSGNTRVGGDARVGGYARMYGYAKVYGDAWETSPLYIQGTKHAVTNSAHGRLSIGCITKTFAEWKKDFKKIGKEYDYTPAQIKEYGAYITLAQKIGK
jgi:UDP-3-O-[3-hydroxymyristoyl] glucosamine N-acyltransferase